mmetsp:Transcript_18641/g.60785  ORF Transcript_18641/g.60785 Transcript_18641/m.60785 type:complete len:234 (+) Transcript_18641:73-774(+)
MRGDGSLSGADGDLRLRARELAVLELAVGGDGPATRGPHERERARHIDDDLRLRRLLHGSLLVEVRAASPADPARHVKEANARDGELAEVLEVAVNDEVGEAVLAAEEARLAVEVEALVRPVDGRLERERRGGVRLVLLQPLLEPLNLLLLALGERLALLAGREAGVRLDVAREGGLRHGGHRERRDRGAESNLGRRLARLLSGRRRRRRGRRLARRRGGGTHDGLHLSTAHG